MQSKKNGSRKIDLKIKKIVFNYPLRKMRERREIKIY